MADRICKSLLADPEEGIGHTHGYAVCLSGSEGGDSYRSSSNHISGAIFERSQQPDRLQQFRSERCDTPPGFLMAAAHHTRRQIELAVNGSLVVDLLTNGL